MDKRLCEWARCFFELSETDRQVLRGLALMKRGTRTAAQAVARRPASPAAAGRARTFVFVEPLVLGR